MTIVDIANRDSERLRQLCREKTGRELDDVLSDLPEWMTSPVRYPADTGDTVREQNK